MSNYYPYFTYTGCPNIPFGVFEKIYKTDHFVSLPVNENYFLR